MHLHLAQIDCAVLLSLLGGVLLCMLGTLFFGDRSRFPFRQLGDVCFVFFIAYYVGSLIAELVLTPKLLWEQLPAHVLITTTILLWALIRGRNAF